MQRGKNFAIKIVLCMWSPCRSWWQFSTSCMLKPCWNSSASSNLCSFTRILFALSYSKFNVCASSVPWVLGRETRFLVDASSVWHESSEGAQGVFKIYTRLAASPLLLLVGFPELANRRRPATMWLCCWCFLRSFIMDLPDSVRCSSFYIESGSRSKVEMVVSTFCSVLSALSEVSLSNIGACCLLVGSWSIWALPGWRSRGAGFHVFFLALVPPGRWDRGDDVGWLL